LKGLTAVPLGVASGDAQAMTRGSGAIDQIIRTRVSRRSGFGDASSLLCMSRRAAGMRCAVILMMLAAMLVAAALASAQTLGFDPAARPLISLLRHTYPGASSRFVNCPGNNILPLENGGEGHVCEFRIVNHRGIFKGSALMVRHKEFWSPKGRIFTIGPIRRTWRRCSLHRLAHGSQDADLLAVRGVTCGEARYLGFMIGYRALNSGTLRIPHRFTEGENGTNTLGFVVGRFHCRGQVRVKQGRENPYGHETARCRTRFGDRFVYVFDQGS
jgi:hypothetical protein